MTGKDLRLFKVCLCERERPRDPPKILAMGVIKALGELEDLLVALFEESQEGEHAGRLRD